MKKLLSILLILVLSVAAVFALTACGDETPSNDENGNGSGNADTRVLPCKACDDGEYVADVKSAASAFEDGLTVYTCNKCSDSYEEITEATGEIKILVIGDSSSSTAISYVDDILLAQGVKTVVIGTANCNHSTGASIDNHITNITKSKDAYTYTRNLNGTQGASKYKQNLDTIMASEDWDYVIIQQSIPEIGTPESYSELDKYLAYLREKKPEKAKILWNMGWAYNKSSSQEDFNTIYGNDQQAMYNAIVNTLITFISENESIDEILPVGAAIQNLRTTFLDGALSSPSGITLATDAGNYVAAVTWCSKILNKAPSEISSAINVADISKYTDVLDSAIAYAIEDATKISTPFFKSIKLLIFGNSYSNDANTYLSDIFLSAGYHEVIIASITDGGCGINHHWWNLDDTLEDYHPASEYDGMTGVEGTAGCSIKINGKTTSVAGDTLKDRYKNTVSAYDWDFVSLQHAPAQVELRDSYDYLPNLIKFVEDNLQSTKTKFVFHMIWKYNDSQSSLSQRTSTHYDTILDITKNIVLKNDQFENRVIPAVTFRQNMTSSFLTDSDISRDYGHMGLTLGRYALGLLWYCYLTGGSIDDVSFVPTKDNVSAQELAKYKNEYNHTHIEITEADMLVVREAVSNALKNPYQITQSVYTTKP